MYWKFGILIVVALLGLAMTYAFDVGEPDEISGVEMAIRFTGFVMFLVGSLGCVSIVGRALRENMTREERVWWELTLAEGRESFVKRLVVTTTLLGGTFISILILGNAYGSGSYLVPIIGCVVIFITLAASSYAVADRQWNVSEARIRSKASEEKKLLEKQGFSDLEVADASDGFRHPDSSELPRQSG